MAGRTPDCHGPIISIQSNAGLSRVAMNVAAKNETKVQANRLDQYLPILKWLPQYYRSWFWPTSACSQFRKK
jgi:hypothetical protein